jgi:nucleoside-diphosphate-sugar epimerase
VIVVFGASSDIGRRVARHLLDKGVRLRVVARAPSTLDPRAERVAGVIADAASIAADAEIVISCAHARLTAELLRGVPDSIRQVVLVGSAWRYSQVPNPRADEVRRAEAEFLGSDRCGVMLHPTMIYGGTQERNLQRLLALIRRWPVLPLPAGGHHLVQPIHVDDVAACIVAATERRWIGPHVIPIAGPAPMKWREMAVACMTELGYRRALLPLPLGPAIGLLALIQHAGFPPPLDPNVLRRFREDVSLPVAPMQSELGITPRPFEIGLRQALAEWRGAARSSDIAKLPSARID